MLKKIYIEITNDCNLNCSFCIHNKRNVKYLSKKEFVIILKKIKPYTKYIYLHVLGEPLLHPLVNEFIELASKDFYVNITTNGVYIEKIKNNKNIRQINISLHSSNGNDKYLQNIFASVKELKKYSYINYRLWQGDNEKIREKLSLEYKKEIKGSGKLDENVFLDTQKCFIWPSLDNDIYKETGHCLGLTDHIAILVDGSIVPCCLDSNNDINLGNIYKDDLREVLNKDIVKEMKQGFKNNKRIQELCKHCGFRMEE